MPRMIAKSLSLLLILLPVFALSPANGQEAGGATDPEEGVSTEPVTVGLYVSPPFVMKGEEEGTYRGMAIDLWEANWSMPRPIRRSALPSPT